jgi:hypothetical protein
MLSEPSRSVKKALNNTPVLTCNAISVTLALHGEPMKRTNDLMRQNRASARKWIGRLGRRTIRALDDLTDVFGFSVAMGDFLLLDGKWYVTHTGLIRLAQRRGCSGIQVHPVRSYCDPSLNRWVFRATVYKSPGSKGFVGYGDADPSNVSSIVHGAEMRVAETRAVNRALRKAYGIGLCSVEELGCAPRRPNTDHPNQNGSASPASGTNGHHNGQPRLRDRLCLLIRQHRLDATLVKAYAADYCGTPALRDASRESIEAFINDLAEQAVKGRDGLLCRLNSYAKPSEVSQ